MAANSAVNLSGLRKGLANVTTPKDLCFLRFLCVSRFKVLTLLLINSNVL